MYKYSLHKTILYTVWRTFLQAVASLSPNVSRLTRLWTPGSSLTRVARSVTNHCSQSVGIYVSLSVIQVCVCVCVCVCECDLLHLLSQVLAPPVQRPLV